MCIASRLGFSCDAILYTNLTIDKFHPQAGREESLIHFPLSYVIPFEPITFMKTKESAKPGLRATLTVDIGSVLFGITCVLLASVFFSAKIMTDEILAIEDQGYEMAALPNPVFL